MARRSDIDWEAVERDYIAGSLTVREIAKKHGIALSTLTLNVKERGWTRNLAEVIKQRTKAKIAAIDVEELLEQSVQESVRQSAQTIGTAVEQAATLNAMVVRQHRAILKRQISLSEKIENRIEAMLGQAADIKDVVALSGAHKSNVDSKVKLIAAERQAFNIDDADKVDGEKRQNITVEFVNAS